jgi:hypothetical protein
MVVAGSTIGSVTVTGIDVRDSTTYTGMVCFDGATCYWGDEYELPNIKTGDMIYANIDGIGAANIKYSTAMLTGDPPPYNVRLAKVESFITHYTIVIGSTTGIDSTVAGTTITSIKGAYTEGDVIVTPTSEDGKRLTLTGTTTTSRILEVVDNVRTGAYMEGANASATGTAIDTVDIKQIHYGDIYVDGRWQ